jgi:hypothetical protein
METGHSCLRYPVNKQRLCTAAACQALCFFPLSQQPCENVLFQPVVTGAQDQWAKDSAKAIY